MSEKFTVLRVDREGVMRSVKKDGGGDAGKCRVSLQFVGVGKLMPEGEIGASCWAGRSYGG